MDRETILILGGYGLAGFPIGRLLLAHTDVEVILAGRNRDRALQAANALNAEFPGRRARWVEADASVMESLTAAFSQAALVINCISTTEHIETTARAALTSGIDHLDILYGPEKIAVLQKLAPEIRAAGCCFITEAGYHPGLPSALVRYAADCLGTVTSAVVGGLIHHPLPYTEAVDDLIRSLETTRPMLYQDGAWREVSWTKTRGFDFGEPFGTYKCSPMDFHEMHELPNLLDLQDTGFYIASMGWIADWLVFTPWVLFKLGRTDQGARLGGKLLAWATRVGMRAPYGVVLKLEANGFSGDDSAQLVVSLRHKDGYLFTAIPVVACVKQLIDGSIRKPGLWLMGHAVQPAQLLADMQMMGIEIEQRMANERAPVQKFP